MQTRYFIPKLIALSVSLSLSFNHVYSMPGMHGSSDKHHSETFRASQSIGDKINTSGAELEITYSADGKTAIFVSTREGSIESPGSPYHYVIS